MNSGKKFGLSTLGIGGEGILGELGNEYSGNQVRFANFFLGGEGGILCELGNELRVFCVGADP